MENLTYWTHLYTVTSSAVTGCSHHDFAVVLRPVCFIMNNRNVLTSFHLSRCKLQPVHRLTFSCTKIGRQKEQLLIAVGVSGERPMKGGSLQGNRHESMCVCMCLCMYVFLHWPSCSIFIVSTYIQSLNGCSHQTKSNKTCRHVYVNVVPRETSNII